MVSVGPVQSEGSVMWKREAKESVSDWCGTRKTQMVMVVFDDGRGP